MLGLIIVATVFVIYAVLLTFQMLRASTEEEVPGRLPPYAQLFVSLCAPVVTPFVGGLLRSVGVNSASRWGVYMREIRETAGLYDTKDEDLMALQIITPAFYYLMFVLVVPKLLTALPLLLIGWYHPILILNRLAQSRKEAMFAELPYVLDLLSLGIEAGLDFKTSVERLVNFSEPSPLINELRLLLNDLDLGTPMEQALLKMRKRIDILAFFTFVEALIQATQIGIDVSTTLRAQAEQMRVSHFQDLEKRANAIPIQILVPSVVGIFPPLLVVVLGPVFMEIWKNPAFK
jgi:tight adherence protein C